MKIIPRKPSISGNNNRDNSYIPDLKLSVNLAETMNLLKPYIEKSADIISRSFYVGFEEQLEGYAVYINGVINADTLNQHILRPLMLRAKNQSQPDLGVGSFADTISKTSIMVGQIKKNDKLPELVQSIFDGMLVLLFDGQDEALVIDIHAGQQRAVDEPPGERSTRGPREGFIENIDVNISLLRRRLRDPRLVVQKTVVGQRSRTQVAIVYIEDLADPHLIQEVQNRINKINIDGITATGYIEKLTEDNPYSLFPQTWSTERPDKATMKLLEGRIMITADGTPLVLMLPSLFIEFFQTSEDYYERTFVSTYIRCLRYLSFFIAVSFPALYIAILSFQPQLIPSDLLISLARARKEVPFTVFFETLIQEIIIQMVIESGLRLPASIGQTVGVVSGIILGQAAISAKLASPGIIVIIAITTISTFALPSSGLILSTRILRLPLLLLSASFGLFGFSLGWLMIITHLSGLSSMGVPFFAPLAPARYADWKDTFFRTFIWKMNERPASIPLQDRRRQGNTGGGNNQGE
ncbi:MAG: spore germination protein [Syntrophomonadaceae bacterium]|nr:spore germination protein [Syntrophomonadaceae bacterium]